jgi:hypothetical protein
MYHDDEAELPPLPYAQLLHIVEKENDILHKVINHPLTTPIHLPTFNLHCGNTTHNSLSITPTLTPSHITTTTCPPTSGNPGDNGKILPSPPEQQIHPNGSTTHNHQTVPTILTTPQPNLSLPSHPTTLHLTGRRKNHHTRRVRNHPVLMATSLQDMWPSTSKKAPRKSGSGASSMPYIILKG